jgi:hypothetical protein
MGYLGLLANTLLAREGKMHRRLVLKFGLALVSGVSLAACGSGNKAAPKGVALAPASDLPQWAQDAPAKVRTAYQFAVANPEALKNVPCYCGCGSIGHTSNHSCYVKETQADGTIVFDDHALGCSLCVDIAQDVLRMTGEGRSPSDIRSEIVASYSKFGPPNQ